MATRKAKPQIPRLQRDILDIDPIPFDGQLTFDSAYLDEQEKGYQSQIGQTPRIQSRSYQVVVDDIPYSILVSNNESNWIVTIDELPKLLLTLKSNENLIDIVKTHIKAYVEGALNKSYNQPIPKTQKKPQVQSNEVENNFDRVYSLYVFNEGCLVLVSVEDDEQEIKNQIFLLFNGQHPAFDGQYFQIENIRLIKRLNVDFGVVLS